MSKLEERERRRKSIVGSIVADSPAPEAAAGGRGRPKESRELKKRVSLSVLPSLYEDIQRIAYVQRRSASELVASILEEYREEHQADLEEYHRIKTEK